MVEIEVVDRVGVRGVAGKLRDVLRRVLEDVGVTGGEWTVTLVGDRVMAGLHRRTMRIGGTTDVLTFDLREEALRHRGTKALRDRGTRRVIELDTVICVDVARRVAREEGHAVADEVLLYAVHSLLHVCGYDDVTEAGARRMHRREDAILVGLGVGRVYAREPAGSAGASGRKGRPTGQRVPRTTK